MELVHIKYNDEYPTSVMEELETLFNDHSSELKTVSIDYKPKEGYFGINWSTPEFAVAGRVDVPNAEIAKRVRTLIARV